MSTTNQLYLKECNGMQVIQSFYPMAYWEAAINKWMAFPVWKRKKKEIQGNVSGIDSNL